jgi:hypothetical protein
MFDKLLKTGFATAAAVAVAASPGAVSAEEFKKTPGYPPPDQPTLPTNPTPGRAEIAGLSRRGDWDLDLSSPPVLIADANPSVAQTQPANCTTPPGRGSDAATFMLNRVRAVQNGLEAWEEKQRSLPPVPGG